MCRDTSIQNGRRCPCDTSEARRLRRHAAAARQGYAALTVPPVEPKTLPVREYPDSSYTVEGIRENIASLRSLVPDLDPYQGGYAYPRGHVYVQKLDEIGAGIAHLAETAYGAPTDETLKSAFDAEHEKAFTKAKEYQQEAQERINECQRQRSELREELNHYAATNESPIPYEIWTIWKEKVPETYQQWKSKGDDIKQIQETYKATRADRQREYFKPLREIQNELLSQRNTAFKKALEAVGVKFADPETLQFSTDSHGEAVKSLKNAISYYPQSWVDASNVRHSKGGPLRVKTSTTRAHYRAYTEQKTFESKTRVSFENKPDYWEPDPNNQKDSEYQPLDYLNGSWTDPISGEQHFPGEGPEGTQKWVRVSYTYHEGTMPPKGKDWEKVEHYEEVKTPEGYAYTGNIVTRYRKPKMSRKSGSKGYSSELTVSKDQSAAVGNDLGMKVAMHEFGHRVEDSHPLAVFWESSFRNHRIGRFDSSVQTEEPSTIYEGKNEIGYKDNFSDHYIGKVYENDSNFEILSVGMESLFAGSNGSLVGAERRKADPGMKKFMLGILASSVEDN